MTYKTGDTIKTTRKLNQMPAGTRGKFVQGWSSGAVVVNFGGNDRVVFMTDIEPAASEPTAEAAQPAHRFPVGAVAVWKLSTEIETVVTITRHYEKTSPETRYSIDDRGITLWAHEHELSAL